MSDLVSDEPLSTVVERVLDSVGEAVIVTDVEGVVRFWNPAAESMFGYPAADAVGRPITSLTVSQPAAEQGEAIMAALSRGESWSGEFPCRRRDGSVFPAYVTDTPMRDEEGRLLGIVGVTRDLSAEKAATLRQRQTGALIETSAQAIVAGDRDGRLTLVNPAAELLLGADAGELMGARGADLVDTESLPVLADARRRLRAGEPVAPVRVSLRRRDGSTVPVSLTIALVGLGGDAADRWVATMVDLSEVAAARAVAHDREARLEALFDAGPVAQILSDLDGRILAVNSAGYALLGYPEDGLVGRHLADITHPDDVADTLALIAAHADAPARTTAVKKYVAADGRALACLLHATTITDLQEQPAYLATVVQDLTQLNRVQDELEDSRQQLAAVLAAVPVRLFSLDRDGRVSFLAGHGVSERTVQEQLGRQVADLVGEPEGRVRATIERVWSGQSATIEAVPADGRVWDVRLIPVQSATGDVTGVVGASVDVTDLVDARTSLAASEQMYRGIVDSAQEGIIRVRNWRVTFANQRMADMLAVPLDDLIGRDFAACFPPDVMPRVRQMRARLVDGLPVRAELRLRADDGTIVWTVVSAAPLRTPDGSYDGKLMLFTDITDRRRVEKELAVKALRDELTGLANRALLADRLDHAVALRQQAGTNDLAVLLLDLDQFKDVNDSRGHTAGDALVAAVARRLAAVARPDDTVARFGGDEFVFVCEGVNAAEDLLATAANIHAALAEPFEINDEEVLVSASIGIAVMGEGSDPDRLLAEADAAMYDAKRRGGAATSVYDDRLRQQARDRVRVIADLHRALADDELRCYYQLVVDLVTGEPVGVEALVRWQHPTRGLLTPAEFLATAEHSGQIIPVGNQVLHQACQTMAAFARQHRRDLSVAVNLSARQFTDPAIVSQVEQTLNETGLRPERLVLEVTESTVMDDSDDALAVMQQLKRLGVRLSVDDFGTGYSSMLYLKRFPIDELKIDLSFVAGIAECADDAAIVASIVSLGRALGVTTVAEGIETSDQAALLRSYGCTHGQGYLFARPVPAEQLPTALRGALRGTTATALRSRAPRRRARASHVPAPTAERILALHTEGASLNTIAAALNGHRLPTPDGKRWHSASVAAVIAHALDLEAKRSGSANRAEVVR